MVQIKTQYLTSLTKADQEALSAQAAMTTRKGAAELTASLKRLMESPTRPKRIAAVGAFKKTAKVTSRMSLSPVVHKGTQHLRLVTLVLSPTGEKLSRRATRVLIPPRLTYQTSLRTVVTRMMEQMRDQQTTRPPDLVNLRDE